MKKSLIIALSCFFVISALNGSNQAPSKKVIRDTLTVLLERPYSYQIKPKVKIIYKGTIYSFSPENMAEKLDMDKNHPIHYAAKSGDVGDIKTLVSWGADLKAKNRFDETPLVWATRGGNFRALYHLIQNGAEITKSRQPFRDFNAFHFALLLPKKEKFGTPTVIKTLQALLQADSNRTHLNQSSWLGTPLELAVKEQLDPHIVRFLIMQGAKITDDVKKGLEAKQYLPIKKALKEGTLRSQMYKLH